MTDALFDGLGSVVGVTDSTGALMNTYGYDPYGNTTAATGTVANPWRYTGAYLDTAAGLYKIRHRYYQPMLGRWTQPDPLGFPRSTTDRHFYAYARGNPVNVVIHRAASLYRFTLAL